MSGKDAEKLLNKLRMIPSNRVCANCLIESRLGFSAVCVKYKTFVCSNCKSSHQAYSHRVKSVTMSTWTREEVNDLKAKNGGGNELARAKWYAKMTPDDKAIYVPKEGDSLDKYKQLIHTVYEKKLFFDQTAKKKIITQESLNDKKNVNKRKPRERVLSQPKAPEGNLLDFTEPAFVETARSESGLLKPIRPISNAMQNFPPEKPRGFVPHLNNSLFEQHPNLVSQVNDPFTELCIRKPSSDVTTKRLSNVMPEATFDPFTRLHSQANRPFKGAMQHQFSSTTMQTPQGSSQPQYNPSCRWSQNLVNDDPFAGLQ